MERVVEQLFEQTKNFCPSVKTGPWNPGSNRQIIRRNETTQKMTFSIEKLMNTERKLLLNVLCRILSQQNYSQFR